MRIAFIDLDVLDYTTDTPYRQPMGGSHSAVCYLAEALARKGHQVALLNRTKNPGAYRGVQVVALGDDPGRAIQSVHPDVAVQILAAGAGEWLKALLPHAK